MTEFKSQLDLEQHKKLAIELFNFTWTLIEKRDRTSVDDNTMVNAAHASRFHWGLVGTPLHFARGEWQISRVYSLVGRAEPALHHAKLSLSLCKEHEISAFDMGFAYEAMARAYAVKGDLIKRDTHVELARQCAERVAHKEDKVWLINNIETVPLLSIPEWT